jgi:hypothetical protein
VVVPVDRVAAVTAEIQAVLEQLIPVAAVVVVAYQVVELPVVLAVAV